MEKDKHYLKKELDTFSHMNTEAFDFSLHTLTDGIWYWDLENPENEWISPRFWEILGYDPKQKKHLTSEWQNLINPNDLKTAIANFHEHCKNPDHPYDQEVRYTHQAGHVIWIRCRGFAIRNRDGVPIRMLGIHTDITSQKENEINLVKKDNRLQHLNQVLLTIRKISQLITAERDQPSLLQQICHLLTENRSFYNAWIILLDDGVPKPPFFHSGFQEDFKELETQLKQGKIPYCAQQAIHNDHLFIEDSPTPYCKSCPLLPTYQNRASMCSKISHAGITYGWLSISIQPEFANDPEEQNLLGEISSDIGFAIWSIQTEEQKRSYETQLRNILNSTNDAISAVDLNGNFILFNKSSENLFQCTAQETLGTHFSKFFPDFLKKEKKNLLERMIAGEKIENHLVKSITAKGKLIDIEITLSWKKNNKGEIKGVVVVIRDKTKEKQAEESHRKEHDFVESLFSTAPVVILVLDTDGNIVRFNPFMEKLTGYSLSEMEGKSWFETFSIPNEKDPCRIILKNALEGHNTNGTINSIKTKDEQILNIEWYNVPLKSKSGKAIGMLSVGLNITEKRKMEEQLRQTQKMEAIGTLAGGIAHDFNNILAAILGYTEILSSELEDEKQLQGYCSQLFKAGNRAKDLVGQILSFSRRSEPENTPIKIQNILKEALQLLRSTLPRSIDIQQDISDRCGTIHGNSTEIHQIIMNLCTNAYHAMQHKGGTLQIKLKSVNITAGSSNLTDLKLSPGHYANLQVCDTGYGIDKLVLSRIFDPYFTTKTREEGTGLGLSVVHGIIKKMGGNITVHSQKNKGTTFDIYIPTIATDQEGDDQENAIKKEKKGDETILIVDDEEQLVELTTMMLKTMGYQSIGFSDSTQALGAFQKDSDRYDLVLTDLTMPDISGGELTEEILKIRSDIPIIICSGFNEIFDKTEAARVGAKAYLSKPVLKNELSETIRKVLDGENLLRHNSPS